MRLQKTNKEFKSFGNTIYEMANGIDNSIVDSTISQSKSISVSLTLDKDTDDIELLKKVLLHQVDEVGRALRKKKLYTTIVAITFKTSEFISFSKQCSTDLPINSNNAIYDKVISLLYKSWNFEKIRNIGVRISGFTNKRVTQTSLFEDGNKEVDDEKIQSVLDSIKDKYGSNIINPASLIDKE